MDKKPELRKNNSAPLTQSLEDFLEFVQKNVVAIAIGLLVLVIAGGALSVWDFLSHKKENQLQAEFSSIEKSYLDKKTEFAEALKVSGKDEKKPETPELKKATGDLSQDFGSEIEQFEDLIQKSPDSKAAKMASLYAAEIYSEYKQNEKALAILNQVSPKNSTRDVIDSLVVNLKASLMAEKGECEPAVDLWQKVIEQRNIQFMHGEAKLRMALCYERLNELAKAEAFYDELAKAESQQADRAVTEDAKKYLRLLRARAHGGT